ncbi:MAG: long-chain fatty acid--CoA ligase [Microbacteriaceae bacterium]|nr:long-chain fatty acid--CoA ligase [Microbacteriaceae bacterium]
MFAALRHLHERAVKHPDRPALVSADGTWSFAELERAVSAVTARLRTLGIAPRQLVATDLGPADDWIVTLALLRIATRSVSLTGVGATAVLAPDALLTRPGSRALDAPTVIAIDRLWIEQAVADADEAGSPEVATVLYPRADATCRIILTSGTTGAPRGVELSIGAVEHRLATLHRYWTNARPELSLMPLSTTGGFHTALACLQHGTPYLAVDRTNERTLRLAAEQGVEVLAGSPVQVGSLVQLMREKGLTLPSLREVRTAGAAATPALLAQIAEVLAVPVRGVYGSTEGGGIATRMLHGGDDPAEVGQPLPGIQLQIVDDEGTPVPDGVSGRVRYRGPGLASGYTAPDPEGSFRGGWFFPGDRGVLTAEGSLVLDGRDSEIVNVGGVKIDPAVVDAAVEGFPGLVDAATFVIEKRPGVPELGLAVVAQADCDLRALDQLLRERLPRTHPTVFGQVAVIPRNRMGKVERGRLTEEFRRRLSLD